MQHRIDKYMHYADQISKLHIIIISYMIVDVSNVADGRLEGASILVSICRFAALSDWVSAKVQALLKPPYCTSYVTAPVEASFPGMCPA